MSGEPQPSTGVIADLPSGEPIPSPGHLPSPKPAPFPLRALLAATPSNVDAFLAHLNRCLSTPSGIDTTLLFVCYTSRVASSALTALSRSALRRSAREWVALVAALPPRTTVLFDASSTSLPSTAAAAAALTLANRLRALSGLVSEARTIMRLWALLGMYFWARGLVQKTRQALRARESAGVGGDEKITPRDERQTVVDAAIAYTQLVACIVFQTLENGAFLSSKGVLGWSPQTQARAGKWSARFLAVHIGVELGRLAAESFGVVPTKIASGSLDTWRKQVIRNMAWMPLTVHWGSEKGFVSDWLIGLIACIPGTIQMGQLWRETA